MSSQGIILFISVLKAMPVVYLCTSMMHEVLVKEKGLTFLYVNAYS